MNFAEFKKKQQYKPKKVTKSVLANVMSNPTKIINILTAMGCEPKIKSNGWIEARCPNHHIHAGHTSSHMDKWNLNADGYCHCFTGNYNSNIISTLAELQHTTDADMIDQLYNNDIITISVPSYMANKSKRKEDAQRKQLLADNLASAQHWLTNPIIDDACLQYFANDGITKQTLDFLGISSVNSGYFQGRAIIPFLDCNKALCGYVAVNYMGKEWWVNMQYEKMHKIDSTITKDDIEKSYKKAIYCTGFSAGNHLYGLFEVLNGALDIKSLVIVEGERDAMKLLQEGIDCVSIHGTALKDEQLQLLRRYFRKDCHIYIGLDMDDAGRKGANILKEKLIPYYDKVDIIDFPDGKDPKKFNGNEIKNIISKLN